MLGKDSLNRYRNQIANLALVIFFVVVSMNLYNTKSKNIASLIKRNEAVQQKNDLLEELKKSARKMKSLRDFINRKDISSALATISTIAAETGVAIDTLRPGAPVDQPLYVKYPFEITLKARNYHMIGKFIGQLENHRDIFIVDALTVEMLSQAPDENPNAHLSAIVRISTVVFKNK